jgi:predicted metal-dependent HD superfamily phosphohydrolase
MDDDHRSRSAVPAWPLPEGEAIRDELLAAYAEPGRSYHGTAHVVAVLERLEQLAGGGTPYDRVPVMLAAWFHDAVYDGERDAEERSAAWAEDALPAVTDPATVAEVARLVRLTESHDPADDDANGCALSDADLGVLALPAPEYADYAAAVRAEYGHLEDAVFDAGRARVLASLAARPRIFRTAYGRELWEQPARDNLERELAALRQRAATS